MVWAKYSLVMALDPPRLWAILPYMVCITGMLMYTTGPDWGCLLRAGGLA